MIHDPQLSPAQLPCGSTDPKAPKTVVVKRATLVLLLLLFTECLKHIHPFSLEVSCGGGIGMGSICKKRCQVHGRVLD